MSELKASAIIKPAKSVEKFVVGKYIIVHTTFKYGEEETTEMYDLTTASYPANRYIVREFVKNNEVIATTWRYSGYTYDFVTDKWYLDR